MFKALNAVAGCIRTRPEVADDTLMQLADVFRYTLRRSRNEWVPLADEVAFVRSYLAVEQTRFGDRLQVVIDDEVPAEGVRVPAMILQPLVENAIRHGTAHTGRGSVGIRLHCEAGRSCIAVRDNGPGFPDGFDCEGSGEGHGLRPAPRLIWRTRHAPLRPGRIRQRGDPGPRERLRHLLGAHPAVEVVGEAETGAQTVALTATLQPDLLLLDIRMPDGSGLEVVARLPAPRPAIVFCTAYDQHAVDAFELQAADYLLKPVSRARLAQCLDRLRTQPPAAPGGSGYLARLLVRSGSRLVVAVEKAAYFESVDRLTKVVTDTGESHWIDPPLQELAGSLDPA